MDLLEQRAAATAALAECPHDARALLKRSKCYSRLSYPDLAAMDAYLLLMTLDEVTDETGEYHEDALECFLREIDYSDDLKESIAADRKAAYQLLCTNLSKCGCFKTALQFLEQAQGEFAAQEPGFLADAEQKIIEAYQKWSGQFSTSKDDIKDDGMSRREIYPWNDHEPDRFSEESLNTLAKMMAHVAPKLEVRATLLPNLEGSGTNTQLGVFAKEDIKPGETLLRETSLLSVNNRKNEALCDACSRTLPELSANTATLSCPDCTDIYFCSQNCFDAAMENYHPTLCDQDVDEIGKDATGREVNNALYFLLLVRAIALSHTREIHPLDLPEVKFIWGDFKSEPLTKFEDSTLNTYIGHKPDNPLPFSFEYDFKLPLHILTTLELPIFPDFDPWILLTLVSKFRGTASARVSLVDGKPEVAAVHPMWCLANHSCAPNVTWEWGVEIRLWCLEEQLSGKRGIKKGEEIWNHYCDVELDYKERREWARGALGGDCLCERCIEEEKQDRRLN